MTMRLPISVQKKTRAIPSAPLSSTGTQLRLAASELQAADRLAASVAQVRAGVGTGAGEAACARYLYLLWSGDDDRADTDSIGASGSGFADCREHVLTT